MVLRRFSTAYKAQESLIDNLKCITDADADETYLSSQESESSQEHEAENADRLKYLNEFLKVGPYPTHIPALSVEWNKLEQSSRDEYLRRLRRTFESIFQIMSPTDWRNIEEDFYSSTYRLNPFSLSVDSASVALMRNLVQAYQNCESKEISKMLLAVLAVQLPYSKVIEIIPGLSYYYYRNARIYGLLYGQGTVAPKARCHAHESKDRNDKIVHFISFILSSNVTTDMPFGTKKIMDPNTGEMQEIPLVVRNLIPSAIVKFYHRFCAQTKLEFEPFHEITLLEILKVRIHLCFEYIN